VIELDYPLMIFLLPTHLKFKRALFRVNHGANEFARDGHCHINAIESFWSFTKRRLAKFNDVTDVTHQEFLYAII